MREQKFRKWKPDIEAIGWPKQIDLIEWHLLVRTANNEKFVCCQREAFLFYLYFSEENETVHVQPHSPCPSNNQSKNDTWRAPRPNGIAWSSNSSNLWSGVGCCDWWAWELCAYNLLGSAAILWKPQQWSKTHYYKFCIKFWPKSLFVNKRLLCAIGPNYPKSAGLRFYQ